MKNIFLSLLLLGTFSYSQNQNDSLQFKEISNEILFNGKAYDNLWDLTQNVGQRLSGSKGYDKATIWAQRKLEGAGADRVWLQETMVPVWHHGEESLKMKTESSEWKEMRFTSLGNSEGTQKKDVEAEVLRVETIEDFEKIPADQVKDKVVFFDYHFPQEYPNTFEGYGRSAFDYRYRTASLVAAKRGKFVVIRSISTGLDDVPHTGVMGYDEDLPKIPSVALGNTGADHLAEAVKKGKVRLKLNSDCGMQEEKINHNVIGEIKGKKDNKVIVLGAHLDSWDVGEGAHDDGAGIVQIIEVLRAFKELGIQNNHTIRIICYANEENGARGGEKYAQEAKKNNEIHLFAIESDAGGFSPRGISLDMNDAKRKEIQSWASLFFPYGVYDFTGTYGGVDVNPLKNEMDVPVAGLVPDSQRYFDLHHSDNDTFDKVNKRELNLGAIAMAQIVYMIDKYW